MTRHPTPGLRRAARLLAPALLAVLAPLAQAAGVQLSGFATVGHAQSDRSFGWQRFIDDDGTWQRDSLAALQADIGLGGAWSATAQARLAPSLEHESRWEPSLTWAFVAWRPDNDWLLRAGRLRVPLFLHSETQDVGTTFTAARLPNEMYWLTPTSDFTGLYVTRNWGQGLRDFTLDAYSGQADTTFRSWQRDGAPPLRPAGAGYAPVRVQSSGMVGTWREPGLTLRAGLHHTRTRWLNGVGIASTFAFVSLAPGLGYYQVDDALPGPGVASTRSVRNWIGTFGAEWQHRSGLKMTTELARVRQFDTELGADAVSGYLSLAYEAGAFTPYVTVGRLLSHARQRDWADRLAASRLPAWLPGAAQVNQAQLAAAQAVTRYDQSSVAAGLAWRLSANWVVKAEWIRASIGGGSRMAEPRPGQPLPQETQVQVRSLVLSTSF